MLDQWIAEARAGRPVWIGDVREGCPDAVPVVLQREQPATEHPRADRYSAVREHFGGSMAGGPAGGAGRWAGRRGGGAAPPRGGGRSRCT